MQPYEILFAAKIHSGAQKAAAQRCTGPRHDFGWEREASRTDSGGKRIHRTLVARGEQGSPQFGPEMGLLDLASACR